MKVLYVDDEDSSIELFKDVFSDEFDVITARSGREALQYFARGRGEEIAVVVTDQYMPEMTGIELLEEILITHPDPVRIILSAYSDEKIILDAINRGKIYQYIVKPWQINTVRFILKQALGHFQLIQNNNTLLHELAQKNRSLVAVNAELREAISRLYDSEERARALLDAPQDASLLLDTQGTILACNKTAEQLFAKNEKLAGNNLFTLLPPNLTAAWRQQVSQCIQSRQPVFFHDERTDSYFENSIFPIMNFRKEVIQLAIYGKDISVRHQFETALKESEEQFRQIAENIKDVLWIRDIRQDKMVYISPSYETIWQKPRASLYADPKSWLAAVHPDDRAKMTALQEKNPKQGWETDYRIILPDSSIRWLRTRAFPIHEQNGEVYRLTGIVEDITEHKITSEKLQETEKRYQAVYDTSVYGICINEQYVREDGNMARRIVNCNETYARLAGRSREELIAQPDIRELYQPGHDAYGDQQEQEDGAYPACSGSYSWHRPDGRENHMECQGITTTIGDRTINYCIHRDVTRLKKFEEQVTHLSKRVNQVAEEERKRIARDLHDEFGQSLLTLRYSIEAIRDALPDEAGDLRVKVNKVNGLIERLGETVQNISSKLRPDMLDHLGLLPTIEWSLNEFMVHHPAIETSLKINGVWKPITPDIEIVLFRVFQEALNNIAKHANPKSVKVLLTFSHPNVILTVSDDGAGFRTTKTFDPPTADDQGIGLYGMQERTASVGGTLTIRSRPGRGTLLRAELPVS
ncbi:MAG: hypothetical protein A2521_02315 [Deltaproteobacteria bacterium RIFOXYD12_FULL_57_12]|nr:MAG: hypothetical protein A2521_02315 [Deltaproteobacteria bacterium RIFOXYD12_FULL_57_12]